MEGGQSYGTTVYYNRRVDFNFFSLELDHFFMVIRACLISGQMLFTASKNMHPSKSYNTLAL